MAGFKEIKRRIKSIKNTKKITKAMELVAASKMRKVITNTMASRMYALYSWEILSSIAKQEKINNIFFDQLSFEEKSTPEVEPRAPRGSTSGSNTESCKKPPCKRYLLILVTSNRGLCGIYNNQIIKKAFEFLKDFQNKHPNVAIDIVTIGKKGNNITRHLNLNVVASFNEIGDNITLAKIAPIAEFVINEYSLLNYQKILFTYTEFISALVQKQKIKRILPIRQDLILDLAMNIEDKKEDKVEPCPVGQGSTLSTNNEYLFEGDCQDFLEKLAKKIVQMQIYQMLLESNTSEQSARMLAMKNASDASGEMIGDLTLVFNKVRQANITREISEISAGMMSVN